MTVYKKDTTGKIRYLEVFTNKDEIIQMSGVLGTENPIVHTKKAKGKNIGKSNETTPEQQAIKEADSIIEGKLQEGYFKTVVEASVIEVILPMLAKDYNKELKKINWKGKVYIQPKFDGMRCLASVDNGNVTLMSRDGRLIQTMPHIQEELKRFPNGVYDGELYLHGNTFQQNMELIKKYRPGLTENISFHCYDLVDKSSFSERIVKVNNILADGFKHIRYVKTIPINSPDSISKYHEKNIEEGYEGSMIRHGDEGYKVNGRSSNLLKFKDFQDITATIIDIEPADQRPEWGVPVLKYSVDKLSGKVESIFRAGTKYTHEGRKDLLLNKEQYIGKTAEIRFFEWSDDGNPRFPVMVGIRLDK